MALPLLPFFEAARRIPFRVKNVLKRFCRAKNKLLKRAKRDYTRSGGQPTRAFVAYPATS
jgi:hypothetical protein